MGEYFNYIELGGKYYLEYQGEFTGWQQRTTELTSDQFDRFSDFMCKQHEDKNKFLKGLVNENCSDS